MAAKKKTKRATTTGVKAHTKAATAATAVAKSVAQKQGEHARAGAEWVSRNANDWQKGANEWAQQSAKLYQFPFASGDVNAATATVKSATENMMRASNDMMSKLFGGTDPMAQWKGVFSGQSFLGTGDAVGKLQSFARESAEQLSRSGASANRTLSESMELSRENTEALVECSNIAVSVSKEICAELISYSNKTFAQNVELGKQLLACRTLNDMFDLSSKVMKTNLDAFFSESVKMSEKLFQCATDIAEPMNERLSESSERISKVIAS
jgi:hypothetical protein